MLVKEVAINWFHLKMQLLPATRQDSGEFMIYLSPRYRTGYASFLTSIFHEVV